MLSGLVHILLLALVVSAIWYTLLQQHVSYVLRLSIATYAVLWLLIPLITSIVTGYAVLETMMRMPDGVDYSDFVTAASIETICLVAIVWIVPRLAKKIRSNKVSGSRANPDASSHFRPPARVQRQFLALSAPLAILLSAYALATFDPSSYVSSNSVLASEEVSGNLATAAVAAALPFLLGGLCYRFWASRSKIEIWVSFGALCVYAICATLEGSRIALITPAIPVVFRYLSPALLSFRNICIAIVAGSTLLFYILPMAIAIGQQRQVGIDASALLQTETIAASIDENTAELFTKFNSISSGSVLVSDAIMGETGPAVAQFQPYLGSALVIFPRAVWPDRPAAGSISNDISGHFTRVAGRAGYPNASDSLNVGVSPAHVTIWQFGYLAVPFFILVNAFSLSIISRFLGSASHLLQMSGWYLLGIPAFGYLIASPDVWLKFFMMTAPLLALCLLSFLGRTRDQRLTSPLHRAARKATRP
jgi:hypothetical protein